MRHKKGSNLGKIVEHLSVNKTMAETTETPLKTVQELITSGQELPEKFIFKGSDSGTFDASPPLVNIPIIDIGLLTSPSSCSQELEKLSSALCIWGCFQAINHGIEAAFLDKIREVSKQFFALPPEKKQKYSKEDGSVEGYGNDIEPTPNWTDRLVLTISPQDRRQLKFWPENPESFREIIDEYSKKLGEIYQILLKAYARSINLEENCFLDMCGEEALMLARFNYMPPCPRPDVVLGLKPHADGSAFTTLLPDKEVEGLQFLKDNQWYRVPIIPQALVINVGDQLEIMSNGIFKSPIHRVVTNSEKERISLVVFCGPDPGKEIEPVNGVVNEAMPRLYKKVKNYYRLYFENIILHGGKKPIEAAML